MLEIRKFARKPLYVDAVEVTAENMAEVAEWCSGNIRTLVRPGTTTEEKYIRVKVHRALSDRQTKAFVGDRVLSTPTGFKVYPPRAFEKSFEKVETLTKEQADEAGITVPIEETADERLQRELNEIAGV